ncbi:hypothetical protein IU11_01600 [Cellulosimicrobium sp. MM]|nr:ATP-binding protein [Cellulosimicrobium sp. MM]KFD44517.1 hypothetical protein IU11_01600 [Cellulosimicrobium sp. MM]
MTPPDDAPLVVLSATASPPWLDALPDAFAALWGQAPWVPADDRLAVELATTEIAANIVRHSPAPETVEVRAELDAGAGRVVVVLRDTATRRRRRPRPHDAAPRGRVRARGSRSRGRASTGSSTAGSRGPRATSGASNAACAPPEAAPAASVGASRARRPGRGAGSRRCRWSSRSA